MSQAALSAYQSEIDLPELSEDDQVLMDKDIKMEEIEAAIASFSPLKSPGLNSLPSEWYGMFRDMLAPRLLQVFDSAREKSRLATSIREALVVLIPKSGKDTKECNSYRPISLMNVDTKILAKVLAGRLQEVILKCINADQTGFMPGMCPDEY